MPKARLLLPAKCSTTLVNLVCLAQVKWWKSHLGSILIGYFRKTFMESLTESEIVCLPAAGRRHRDLSAQAGVPPRI